MTLPHVVQGDPHVQAHNDERDEINSISAKITRGIANAGPLYAYGPSYYAYTATSVADHFNRLRRRLGSKVWCNFGVGSMVAGDMNRYAFGVETFNRQYTAADEENYTLGPGTWFPSLNVFGVMLIDPFRNDAGLDGRTLEGGTTAKARAAARNSLDCWLRFIRAKSIVTWGDASFAFEGTWSVLGPIPGTRSNAMNYSVTPGSKFTITWTGPDLDLNLLGVDDSNSLPGSPFTMKLNGAAYAPAGYPSSTVNQFRKTLKGAPYALMSIPVRGANAGTNTLEVTKGAGAGYLLVDSYMIPSSTPMTVIIEKVSALGAAGYQTYVDMYGAVGAGPAVDAVYNDIIDQVVARFPQDGSIVVVDHNALGFNPATMLAKSDNVHRNDIGEHFIANNLYDVINNLQPRNGLIKMPPL